MPRRIESYAQVFEEEGRSTSSKPLPSLNGPKHYRLPPNEETITLEKSAWTAPEEVKSSPDERRWLSWRRNDRVEGCIMTAGLAFPTKRVMAELTAKMLLEVEAVRFMSDKPSSSPRAGRAPVYTDCRRLISFPRVRRTLIDFDGTLMRDAGSSMFDAIAGGETAGIRRGLDRRPARLADALRAQEAQGFGRNAQIEGHLVEGQRVLLVEDMTSDGRSKINFCKALRTPPLVLRPACRVAHELFHLGELRSIRILPLPWRPRARPTRWPANAASRPRSPQDFRRLGKNIIEEEHQHVSTLAPASRSALQKLILRASRRGHVLDSSTRWPSTKVAFDLRIAPNPWALAHP